MAKRMKAGTPGETATNAAALREAQAARAAPASPHDPAWAVHPAGEPAPVASSTTLGAALAAWAATGTNPDFAAAFKRLTKAAHPSRGALHRLAWAMDDQALRRAVREMRAELAAFADELERREALAARARRAANDARRSLVDLDDLPALGDPIPSMAGPPIAFRSLGGQGWVMDAGQAARMGRPELAGKTVCYGYSVAPRSAGTTSEPLPDEAKA